MLNLFIIFNIFHYAYSYNILVYSPSYAASHTNFLARIADTLTEAGHNVTFLIPVADETRKHQLIVKKTKDVILVEQDEQMRSKSVDIDNQMAQYWTTDTDSSNVETIIGMFMDEVKWSCDTFLRNKKVIEELKSRKFDVGIYEPTFVCGLGFMHSLGIRKTIMASSCTLFDGVLAAIGEPTEYSFMPGQSSRSSDKMGILERMENYKVSIGYRNMQWKLWDEEMEIYRKYLGDHIPHWRDLMPTSSVYFTNSVVFLDFPRATFQKTIPIGGIAVDTSSGKLSDEWSDLLDERSKNLLISFGSMLRSMDLPDAWRNGILEAIMSEPNVTFIWKYESDDLKWAEGVKNIRFSKWVPQSALLNDPRLTAFITHGGLGSTNELAHLGKPALMVPALVDQYRNANMLSRHGGVKMIHKSQLENVEIVKRAVHSILYDEELKKMARKLADLLQNQPMKPKDVLVKYTEFVAKYGPFPEMDPEGRKMGFVKRNLLDVYFLIGLSYLSYFVVIVGISKFLFGKIKGSLKLKKIE